MALSWDTYRSIPMLNNYAEAKAWHDNVTPIRGDQHKLRPVGRRDQKWFNIWETKDAIHVGYGRGALDQRQPLVSFRKEGSIIVSPHYRGASTNERLQRLLGVTFQTHQYDTWVNCAYYDNGEKKRGWLPIVGSGPAMFVREGDSLTYVNYKYPVTHKINKERMKAFMDEYQPFLAYLSGLRKLQGGERLEFSNETRIDAFGVNPSFQGREVPNAPPNLRWGAGVEENRAQLFAWAKSDEPMDQLRAAITLANMSYWDNPIETFKEYVIRTYRQAVLDVVEHRTGTLVRDKLRKFLF